MTSDISLVGEKQLVMTEQGYTPLGDLYEQYVAQRAPKLAAVDRERRFSMKELTRMERSYHEGEVIRVQTDTFEILARPQHRVWVATGPEGRQGCFRLEEIFGQCVQFMGIFPMAMGECPGYLVGKGAWYREQVQDFVFDLLPESGFVFSRTGCREAGIWSGIFPEPN